MIKYETHFTPNANLVIMMSMVIDINVDRLQLLFTKKHPKINTSIDDLFEQD